MSDRPGPPEGLPDPTPPNNDDHKSSPTDQQVQPTQPTNERSSFIQHFEEFRGAWNRKVQELKRALRSLKGQHRRYTNPTPCLFAFPYLNTTLILS